MWVSFWLLGWNGDGVSASVRRDDFTGVRTGDFECYENHKLSLVSQFYAGQTTKVASYMDCGLACVARKGCVSYNFGVMADAGGKHVCELLSTDKYNKSGSFLVDPNFHHFTIRVRSVIVFRAKEYSLRLCQPTQRPIQSRFHIQALFGLS